MKILLVEDEPKLSAQIKKGLEENKHQVIAAYDGFSALNCYQQEDFTVIILDIVMRGMSGLEFCARIRDLSKPVPPVLMLTALGTTEDVVTGLNAGADDYLTKPFRFKELLARLNALERRGPIVKKQGKVLFAGDLALNCETKSVSRAGKEIALTSLEFRLLEYLLKNKNRVVSKFDILDNVWHENATQSTNAVEVYINYLRNKVDKPFPNKLIKTLVGMGYAIKDK